MIIQIISILSLSFSINFSNTNYEELLTVNNLLATATVIDTIYFDLDGDLIAIPSIFIQEQEGASNHFYPTFNNDKITISQFVINTIEDDWKDVKLMYSTKKLVYKNNSIEYAWDGTDLRNEITKTFHEGPFRFKFYASKPGAFLKCEGVAFLERSK